MSVCEVRLLPERARGLTEMLVFGYHPMSDEFEVATAQFGFPRALVVDDIVSELFDKVETIRVKSTDEAGLPSGIYWFVGAGSDLLMQVSSAPPGTSSRVEAETLDELEGHPLLEAYRWAENFWNNSADLPRPKFQIGERALTIPGGTDVEIKDRTFYSGSWSYATRGPDGAKTFLEEKLAPMTFPDQPEDWISGERSSAERLGATLTRIKLQGRFSDTVYSFQATRTVFRPYQFKPVLKLLQSGHARLLIADEVGLGKTIEAGLIWTELEARHDADRVLIVCPSVLVEKWRDEMQERFGFDLAVLNREELSRFREQHREGRVPRRRAYVASLETLRTWDGLDEFREFPPEFDLVIVDEAHSMRNSGTKSYLLGTELSEWTAGANMVFLTATPINLHETDLLHLLGLLEPADFVSSDDLEVRLAPNAVLNEAARQFSNQEASWSTFSDILIQLNGLVLEKAIKSRPEYGELVEILKAAPLSPTAVAEARKLVSKLNALSTTVTRTRRAEVAEDKAVRDATGIQIVWNEAESAFYEEYLKWCDRRAKLAKTAMYFAMQMPIRLASTSVHVAARNVLRDDPETWQGDTPEDKPKNWVEPHDELIQTAKAVLDSPDSKLERLGEVLSELHSQGRPALLFTWSKATLNFLKDAYSPQYRIAVLNGDVPRNQRRKIMKDFRAGSYDFLFANRVASEGLDFEFCSAVINYDLPWNPMEVEQRIGRIDRIGQTSEKILIRNFYNDEAIDSRIMFRVLERIGIFERSIGELEPIIGQHMDDLHAAMDFTLSEKEREEKEQQFLIAIETQKNELREVADSSASLMISNDVEIAGLEEELISTGRYVGAKELKNLVEDWASTDEGGSLTWLDGNQTLQLIGNSTMASRLARLTEKGTRTRAETSALISDLQNQQPILLSVDQEIARTSGVELLSATHPLVVAAVEVPGHRQARFASIRISATDKARTGSYLVVLAHAQNSTRGGDELWGSAVALNGEIAGEAPADALLSSLAKGDLSDGSQEIPDNLAQLVSRAKKELQKKHRQVQIKRDDEEQLLAETRKAVIADQHQRRLAGIERRLTTIRERDRGPEVVRMIEGQKRRQQERNRQLLSEIETEEPPAVSLSYLAVCLVEVSP